MENENLRPINPPPGQKPEVQKIISSNQIAQEDQLRQQKIQEMNDHKDLRLAQERELVLRFEKGDITLTTDELTFVQKLKTQEDASL